MVGPGCHNTRYAVHPYVDAYDRLLCLSATREYEIATMLYPPHSDAYEEYRFWEEVAVHSKRCSYVCSYAVFCVVDSTSYMCNRFMLFHHESYHGTEGANAST